MAASTIETHNINIYNDIMRHVLQQTESKLSTCVASLTIKGEKTALKYLGLKEMQEKTERHEDTVHTETTRARRWCKNKTHYTAELVDPDDISQQLTNPTGDLIIVNRNAAVRQKDRTIINAFDADVLVGKDGTRSKAFPTSQILDIQMGSPIGAPANQGMNLDKLKEAKFFFDSEDVPEENRFMGISAQQLKELLTCTEITNADYAAVKALVNGQISQFMGFNFIRMNMWKHDSDAHIRSCFAWQKDCIGHGNDRDVQTTVDRLPQKTNSVQVLTQMRDGAGRINDAGVIQIPCHEIARVRLDLTGESN